MTPDTQAIELAETALRLHGADKSAYIEQFRLCASGSSIVRVEGDGLLFKQALCFPVTGVVQYTDTVVPFPGL